MSIIVRFWCTFVILQLSLYWDLWFYVHRLVIAVIISCHLWCAANVRCFALVVVCSFVCQTKWTLYFVALSEKRIHRWSIWRYFVRSSALWEIIHYDIRGECFEPCNTRLEVSFQSLLSSQIGGCVAYIFMMAQEWPHACVNWWVRLLIASRCGGLTYTEELSGMSVVETGFAQVLTFGGWCWMNGVNLPIRTTNCSADTVLFVAACNWMPKVFFTAEWRPPVGDDRWMLQK